MFEHFDTVREREKSASRTHRKRVTFVTLRSALDLDGWLGPETDRANADPSPPSPPPSPSDLSRDGDAEVIANDSGAELSSSDSICQASPGAPSSLPYRTNTLLAEPLLEDTEAIPVMDSARVSTSSINSIQNQLISTRRGRRLGVGFGIGDNSQTQSKVSHYGPLCPPKPAKNTRAGSLDTRVPPGSGSLSVRALLVRVGLALLPSELETPTRRWVRTVRISDRCGQSYAIDLSNLCSISTEDETGDVKTSESRIKATEVKCIPNLWNKCNPPPGLLVVPDAHLPPF